MLVHFYNCNSNKKKNTNREMWIKNDILVLSELENWQKRTKLEADWTSQGSKYKGISVQKITEDSNIATGELLLVGDATCNI